jgi:periplasmic protein TonB
MSDLGNLSHCILDADAAEIGQARWHQSRAVAVSTLSEAAALVCLLAWPLMRTGVLPEQPMPAPVPVFHPIVHSNPPPAHLPEHSVSRPPTILTEPVLLEPPRIPTRVETNAGAQPPVDFSLSAPQDGPDVGNPGFWATNVVPAQPKPRPAAPVVVSGGVMAARLIHRVQPEYPRTALMIHLAGTIQLRAIIGMDGSVRNLEIVSGNPILAEAALDAVRQWRYQPTRLSGRPVEVETLITVDFQMQ